MNGAIENSQEYFSVNPTYTLLDGSSIGVGSSGGPVWVTGSNGEPYVVGLVSSGDGGVGSAGYFVQITTAALDQIDAWLAEDNGAAPAPVPAPVSTPPPIPTETVIAVDGTHSQYEIARDPTTGNVTVADTVASRDGTQTVHALSDISFTDGTGVIDPTGNAEETARLYQAALDRAPDLTGLDEWTAALNAGTLNIDGVALAFISSPEFQAKYGALDNTAFVVQLYQNVLHRSPDPTGEQGWVNQLNNGMSRAQALVGFSDSLENELDTQGTIGDPDIAEVYRLYQTAFDRPPDRSRVGHLDAAVGKWGDATSGGAGIRRLRRVQPAFRWPWPPGVRGPLVPERSAPRGGSGRRTVLDRATERRCLTGAGVAGVLGFD